MIRNFGDRITADIYDGEETRYARKIPHELHGKICRVLDQMNAAPSLEVLKSPPGNRLERLKGDLKEFWSLRINDQWRIVFKWDRGDAHEVRITDYH
ncbi:MAG: type II toxin-antitoxin system RelE/ParE family toxin [Nitrospinae bacterium]|nr:type II toxin-antitoxin system RelE/ParE family toxin [Nitrospinota bacterium]